MSLAQLDQDVAKPRQAGFAPLIAALSGVLALVVAVSVELLWQRLGLGIFGIMLIAVAGYERLRRLLSDLRGRMVGRVVASVFSDDRAPVLLADDEGHIVYRNRAAGRSELSQWATV